jgi:hypothetical protein
MQALSTAGPVHLVAMADAFRDRLDARLAEIVKSTPSASTCPSRGASSASTPTARRSTSTCDVVILTTPPGFRPLHFDLRRRARPPRLHGEARGRRRARRARGAGGRREAKKKDLKVGVGLQRHHDPRLRRDRRAHPGGAIGKVLLYRCYWNSAGVWTRAREAAGAR